MAADFIVSKDFIKPAEPEFLDEYLSCLLYTSRCV